VGRRRAGAARLIGLALAALVLGACVTTRVVPVPAAGVALDPAQGTATVEAEGVQLVVRPSAWRGSPSSLPDYVTPFHLLLVDGSPWPLTYDYPDLRLFDEAGFQYTALPPAEVERILRSEGPGGVLLAASVEVASTPVLRRRAHDPVWDPWWWGPPFWAPWWWSPPLPPYGPPPRLEEIYLQALPVGTLQAGARTQGFVYFPRLRPGASRLTLEFHFRLAGVPRVLTVPFGIERTERGDRAPRPPA
jgi:hypothetical protein